MKRIIFVFVLLFSTNSFALPPQVEADMLMLEAKKDMDNSRWEQAVTKFEKISTLKAKMPETFDYHWAVSSAGAGYWSEVGPHLDSYLNRTGTGGKFYKEALELYSKSKEMIVSDGDYKSAASYVIDFLGSYLDVKRGKPQKKDDKKVSFEESKAEIYIWLFGLIEMYPRTGESEYYTESCTIYIPDSDLVATENSLKVSYGGDKSRCEGLHVFSFEKLTSKSYSAENLNLKSPSRRDADLFNKNYAKVKAYLSNKNRMSKASQRQ